MTEEFNESMINDIKEGDKITGEVQSLEDKQVIVHVNGGKFNGIIPISQLSTHHIDNPSDAVNVGDEIEAYVTKVELDDENETGAYILSKRQLETEKSYDYLQEKLDSNEAGINPRCPTSTTKPPFTTSVTLASIFSSLSNFSCKNSYDFSVSNWRLDKI